MKRTLCSIRAIYKISAFIILFFVPRGIIFSQVNNQPDYKKIFGEQYIDALKYLSKNQWITTTLINNRIDPCFAKSIIFPELIRYSYIRDKMELQALKTLYVQYGQKYANFSVGRFQIKPSFAEKVEIDLKQYADFKSEPLLKGIDTTQTSQARLERVKRLETETWQLQYLIWFINLVQKKFDKLNVKPETERLLFFATAYNCGYLRTEEQIKSISRRKYFHTEMFKGKNFFNYADISIFYWNHCTKSSK